MTINLETALSHDELGERLRKEAQEQHEAVRALMSPPDSLGLSPLLEKRRWEIGIIDAEFKCQQATYDRVLIHQLDEITSGGETFIPGGRIVKTERQQSASEKEAPRGIIVSAGLRALDILRSNGMDVGHRVLFQKMTPYGIEVAKVRNKPRRLLILIAGDILASEDTASALWEKELHVICRKGQHQYEDKEGRTIVPLSPWQSSEY